MALCFSARHFQRYPLIYLTFKDVKQDSWAACYETLAELIVDLYREHRTLLASGNLVPEDQEFYTAILERRASRPSTSWHSAISRGTSAYHGERVVILIDEYDTPLHKAFVRGYYDEAVGFFRGFLSGGLKDNQHLFKGVLTGILRIAKESLFSGLNNLGVYSLLSASVRRRLRLYRGGGAGSHRPVRSSARWRTCGAGITAMIGRAGHLQPLVGTQCAGQPRGSVAALLGKHSLG